MRYLLFAMWVGWLGYWGFAARRVKPRQWREPLRDQWLHNALVWIGVIILLVPRATPAILGNLLRPPGAIGALVGLGLTALGLGIAVAARISLAGNWSAAVEIKEDHVLIRTGLYRHVRHPIYSGLLLALLGTAIALNRWRALVAFGVIFAALWLKARHEEAGLRRALPGYAAYARETAALIPFLF